MRSLGGRRTFRKVTGHGNGKPCGVHRRKMKYVKIFGKSNTKEKLTIPVKVIDVKTAYGQKRYLVEPLNGAGRVWKQKVYNNK